MVGGLTFSYMSSTSWIGIWEKDLSGGSRRNIRKGGQVNVTGKQCLHVLNSPQINYFLKLKTGLREKFIVINFNIKKYSQKPNDNLRDENKFPQLMTERVPQRPELEKRWTWQQDQDQRKSWL